MRLQTKIIAIVIGLFAILLVLNISIQLAFILPSFKSLEREEAGKNMGRAIHAIEREVEHLDVVATDWGTWTDTWDFMRDHNEDYISSNLNLDALKALKVELMVFIDTSGVTVWSMVLGDNGDSTIILDELTRRPLPPGHPLRASSATTWKKSGIFMTRRGPVLLAARAIITSSGQGPVQGSIIFGRFLDKEATERIATQAGVSLAILPVDSLGQATSSTHLAQGKPPRLEPDKATECHFTEREHSILVRRLVKDMSGEPALLLTVQMPRTIMARGRNALGTALGFLGLAAVATLGALIIVLRRMVLEPTRRLTRHAASLGASGAPAACFDTDRRDEFGILAGELNRMMLQLEETRKRLLEQSFSSGVAEMAAGILHNIGNSLTPLTVQVDSLQREIRSVAVTDMELALKELAAPGIPAARREDLGQFAELTIQELQATMARAGSGVATIAAQVGHIGQILADQERYSRQARVLEPASPGELLRETVDMLDAAVRQRLDIILDPSLEQFGKGMLARAAMQQIFANLIINAAESHDRTGRERGRLFVKAELEPASASDNGLAHAALRLVFEDDGAGIQPEQMDLIFTRGFSTKEASRASGLGLHWCSNTLHALGGGIRAESAGAGQGARLHVVIPWCPEGVTQHIPGVREMAA